MVTVLSTMYSEHFKFEYVFFFFISTFNKLLSFAIIYWRNPSEDIDSEANALFWPLFDKLLQAQTGERITCLLFMFYLIQQLNDVYQSGCKLRLCLTAWM